MEGREEIFTILSTLSNDWVRMGGLEPTLVNDQLKNEGLELISDDRCPALIIGK
jgi:hypothetical protein